MESHKYDLKVTSIDIGGSLYYRIYRPPAPTDRHPFGTYYCADPDVVCSDAEGFNMFGSLYNSYEEAKTKMDEIISKACLKALEE